MERSFNRIITFPISAATRTERKQLKQRTDMKVTTVDPATCAALHEMRMHHLQLHLDVDMAARRIAAEATLSMKRLNGYSGRRVQLDVFHLQIHDVAVLVDANVVAIHENEEEENVPVSIAGGLARLPVAKWEIKPFTSFGEILSMELPAELDAVESFQLHICYETEQDSPAVCWLDKEQTAGKQHPFMYTQGQEVLNRSFFPCQDSPSVRITYEAGVIVPSELVCVMSAELLGSGSVDDSSSLVRKTAFQFEMKQSIPVYLVAMAVGDLVCADVGPRSSVWTEPCMLESCKKEFTGILENYLAIGEQLFGEYLWERYDLLVMPPSFPYGGMENPRLTFVSPCIIAGDQSLCSIVAHEISHSWFGNLVTNASWSDFFLNEGFTMYAERRITEEAHGRPLMCLNAKIGEALLKEEIASLGVNDPLTRLRVPLETGIDPGDCYNQCAYEKGYVFVCYLRSLVGSDEIFDQFLRDYTQHFKFQSIPAEEMMAFFLRYFPTLADGDDLKAPIKFSTWLHEPGFPLFEPDLSDAKDMVDACESLLYYWQSSYVPVQANVLYLTMESKTWHVNQVLYFIDLCVEAQFAHTEVIVELGDALGFYDSANAEILFRWSQVLIKNAVAHKMDFVGNFLTIQGKQKFLIPIYRLLAASSNNTIQRFAFEIYEKTKPTLHVMVRDRIEAILKSLP